MQRRRAEGGWSASGQLLVAEGMAAVLALEVVKYGVVDNFADRAASGGARYGADQRAHHSAGDTAEEHARWARERADDGAGLSASHRGGGSAACTRDTADDAARGTGIVMGDDAGGMAVGAREERYGGKGLGHINLMR